MIQHQTIGQLARDAGVPTSTIRYYERRGLLAPSGRSCGNYRVYGPDEAERLAFIRAAQTAGFTLADIEALLRLQDERTPACAEVQQLLSARLGEADEQLRQLRALRKTLGRWMDACKEAERGGRCAVIEGLTGKTA